MSDHKTNHIQNMDSIAKEGIRNLLRHGANMLRIQAKGARNYAEHVRQMEAVEEIASTQNSSDQESDEERLTDARFKALLAYEANIEGYLIMSKAKTEGWKPSNKEFDSHRLVLSKHYGRAKATVDTIRSDDIEAILSVVEELTPYTNTTMDILRDIKSKLGEAKYESFRKHAYGKLKGTYMKIKDTQ